MIHLLASGEPRAEMLIRKVVDERSASIDEWRELRNLLAQHRSIELRAPRRDRLRRAREDGARDLPASAERDALMFLPDYVLSRDR